MTKRGAKSHTTIAGHTLTYAELTVLNQVQDYLRKNGGDSNWSGLATRSWVRPKGDGRSVPLLEIFPGAEHRGKRHAARHLEALGVLQACDIELLGEMLKGKPQ